MDNTTISLIASLITSAIGNFLLIAKLAFDRKDTSDTKLKLAETTAYEQLSGLFNTLKAQLEKKELSDQEKDEEIERLEKCCDRFERLLKKSRLDLVDPIYAVKDVKRLLKSLDVNDELVLLKLEEIEKQLVAIGDFLKCEDK